MLFFVLCGGLFCTTRHTRTMSATTSQGELPPALAKLVDGLASLPDDKFRYKQLLFWASDSSSDIEESLKTDENKVPGCLSTVHIHASLQDDGTVLFKGDSDAQLTKGLVTLLVKGLSGSTPEMIATVDPSFIKDAGIAQSLTPGRNNGFVNMLAVMKAKAASLSEASPSQTKKDAKSARGPVATEMIEKLSALNPVVLELVDESSKHAGHAGSRGFENGESHFKLDIVAECFDGLSKVKRHQLIYTMLGPEIMKEKIHALQITTAEPPSTTSA